HFDDHANSALMGSLKESFEIFKLAVAGVDRTIVGNIVAIVSQRRSEKWHQPDRGNAEFLQVVQLLRQSPEIAVAIAAAVIKSADVYLIDDCVLVPKPVLQCQILSPRLCVFRRGLRD